MAEKLYIIHATDRGFWKEHSRGYTLNPAIAGVYTEREARDICRDTSRKEKMYELKGRWHKNRIKKYRNKKMEEIQRAMEGLSGEDIIEMMVEIIKERRKRNC